MQLQDSGAANFNPFYFLEKIDCCVIIKND
jgi:hypothetical protein